MKKFFEKLKSLLFVKNIKCINCGKELSDTSRYCLCDECVKLLPTKTNHTCKKCDAEIKGEGNVCLRCKTEVFDFDYAISPFVYEGIIKSLVHRLKYSSQPYLAEYLSKMMYDRFNNNGIYIDYIIPIPLYKDRLKSRGYNQAELLCSEFVKNGYIVRNDIVQRTKATFAQYERNYEERKENLKDAFTVVDKKAVKDKIILLVDDILTTGSTCNECAKKLLKAKAKAVIVLTLSVAEKKDEI